MILFTLWVVLMISPWVRSLPVVPDCPSASEAGLGGFLVARRPALRLGAKSELWV
jgi:hypothetical protein